MPDSPPTGKPTQDSPVVPNGWRQVRLGEVLKLEYGVSLPERKRLPGHVPVVGSAGRVGLHSQATNKGPGIVVGRKGSIGSVTWLSEDFVPIDTTYFAVPIDGQADLRWLFYLLDQENLSRLNRATGVPGLNRDDVYALRKQIPPFAEQRAIAEVLDSIDEAIEASEAVVVATENLRDALLHRLLTRGVPGWHSEWKEVRGIGPIPANWNVVRLGDVLESTTYGTNVRLGTDGDTLILRMNNLQNGKIDLSEVRRANLTDTESGNLNLVYGDILFNRTNSLALVGKTAIVHQLPNATSFASYLVRLRVQGSRANPFWLAALLASSSCQSRIRRLATPGVSQANINPTSLKSLTIPLPSLPEQATIAKMLDSIDEAIEYGRIETENLRHLKASTADALLTGRMRIAGVNESI